MTFPVYIVLIGSFLTSVVVLWTRKLSRLMPVTKEEEFQMKGWRRFCLWSAGLLFALILLVVPAAPALALTGEIKLADIKGPVGMRVGISGTGFTDGSFATIYFNGSPIAPANIPVDIVGFSAYFYVPNLRPGRYPVTVTTNAGDASNTDQFEIVAIINPQITISSASGNVGDQVTVSGSGFTASSTARILFDGDIVSNPVSTGSAGDLTDTVITIPETTVGSHTFSARDIGGTVSQTLSYVVSPKIAVTPNSGGAGDQVTVSGSGFGSGQSLSVYFDNALVAAAAVSSAQGVLPGNFVFAIPPSSRGSHTVEVRGGSTSATAAFNVAQKITVSPLTGSVGTTVSVIGLGFTPNQVINIISGGPVSAWSSPTVGIDGSFSGSFTVTGAAGVYLIEVGDGALTSSRSFTVVVTGSLEPKEGNVGTNVSINATGFVPGATATVTFDGVEMAQVKVAANGGIKVTFKAPAVGGGDYEVAASDSVNSFSDTFNMESVAPLIPELVSPEDEARAGRVLTFEWGAVSDPSGVTYKFQLATDADFTRPLFDEEGLANPEFSVKEADRLDPVSKDEPYYWRVKAVDGAFNESDWSQPFSFSTGFNFALPTWSIWVLSVLGTLLIGFLGFWIGRRTAYYF